MHFFLGGGHLCFCFRPKIGISTKFDLGFYFGHKNLFQLILNKKKKSNIFTRAKRQADICKPNS